MYIKLKSNVMFRNYGSFGYITDNRNFGYKQANDNGNDIGDKIVSQSGAVFLTAIERKPQTIDCIIQKISMQFSDIDVQILRKDAIDFFNLLEEDGFIISGDTVQECNDKDIGFTYKQMKPIYDSQNRSRTKEAKDSTQDFFEDYFSNNPQLTNLHIEITSLCNERCVHCYIPHKNKETNISPILFYDILEQCKDMNVLHLTISGGEPMLHKDFIEFLRKCNEYNFSVNILSNLTLLNKEILDEMKKNPLLSVQVSLYSMNSTIHDRITQVNGSFEKTKRAILQLLEYDIPMQISCPIIKQNYQCYNDVVKWGKANNISVGSDYVIIAEYNHEKENLNNRLSLYDVKELLNQRIDNDPQYLEQISRDVIQRSERNPDDFICSVCHSSVCISENGYVYPCAGWQDYILGDAKKTPIREIWSDSQKINYLRNLRRRDFIQCSECLEKDYCTMCMVRNANEDPDGDMMKVNQYFCEIAKIMKKIMAKRGGGKNAECY